MKAGATSVMEPLLPKAAKARHSGTGSTSPETRPRNTSNPGDFDRHSGDKHSAIELHVEYASHMIESPRTPSASSCLRAASLAAILWGSVNVLSSVGIVFVNKLVLQTCGFRYPVTLTLLHAVFTVVGLQLMAMAGVFKAKKLGLLRGLPLALAYVGYIVLANLSLQLNPVSLYQILKIATTPGVVLIELLAYAMVPGRGVLMALAVLLVGVTLATVNELNLTTSILGLTAGVASTVSSSVYQVWASRKQKEYDMDGLQLLHACTPAATLMLAAIVPLVEPMGEVMAYRYTPENITAIVGSSVMGIAVTLSAFLMIGVTSSLTYNVLGHSKSVMVLMGGFVLFHELMGAQKMVGLVLTMAGVIWYTAAKMTKGAADRCCFFCL